MTKIKILKQIGNKKNNFKIFYISKRYLAGFKNFSYGNHVYENSKYIMLKNNKLPQLLEARFPNQSAEPEQLINNFINPVLFKNPRTNINMFVEKSFVVHSGMSQNFLKDVRKEVTREDPFRLVPEIDLEKQEAIKQIVKNVEKPGQIKITAFSEEGECHIGHLDSVNQLNTELFLKKHGRLPENPHSGGPFIFPNEEERPGNVYCENQYWLEEVTTNPSNYCEWDFDDEFLESETLDIKNSIQKVIEDLPRKDIRPMLNVFNTIVEQSENNECLAILASSDSLIPLLGFRLALRIIPLVLQNQSTYTMFTFFIRNTLAHVYRENRRMDVENSVPSNITHIITDMA